MRAPESSHCLGRVRSCRRTEGQGCCERLRSWRSSFQPCSDVSFLVETTNQTGCLFVQETWLLYMNALVPTTVTLSFPPHAHRLQFQVLEQLAAERYALSIFNQEGAVVCGNEGDCRHVDYRRVLVSVTKDGMRIDTIIELLLQGGEEVTLQIRSSLRGPSSTQKLKTPPFWRQWRR